MNILEHLIEHHGGTTAALDVINRLTGGQYKLHRLYEWRNGKRRLPQRIYESLVYHEVESAMRAAGVKPGKSRVRTIRRRLSLPPYTRSE